MVLEGRKRSKEIRPAFLFLCLLFLPARAAAAGGMDGKDAPEGANRAWGVCPERQRNGQKGQVGERRTEAPWGPGRGPPGTAGQRKRFWSSATGTGPALCWKKGGAPGEKRAPGMKAGRDDAGSRRGAAAEDHDRIRKKGRRARDCCRSGNLELSLVFCARQQKYGVAQSS